MAEQLASGGTSQNLRASVRGKRVPKKKAKGIAMTTISALAPTTGNDGALARGGRSKNTTTRQPTQKRAEAATGKPTPAPEEKPVGGFQLPQGSVAYRAAISQLLRDKGAKVNGVAAMEIMEILFKLPGKPDQRLEASVSAACRVVISHLIKDKGTNVKGAPAETLLKILLSL